ncbi:death-associated inhibitor of apoptosis 2 [Onthophagus taurus]|uniref:death-associated inhibitor of apoptosis 2 n=1 Tax=Onthophagus taurus TaxID=166361 RepID=UPI000C20EB59|nr:baculoviral IAP repeat-containing protein 7-B [Onthophagus taurus]
MNIEKNRLKTYRNWPPYVPVSLVKLAKAGFYYTGRNETVKCFSCEIEISGWEFGDPVQVMGKHRSSSPQCPFVLNQSTCGNIPHIPHSYSVPTNNITNNTEDYKTESARLQTFANWPKLDVVAPEALAKSGFYSLKVKDYVKCAFCDVVLISWEQGDNPNTEHYRCSPNCSYLKLMNNERNVTTSNSNSNLLLIEGDGNLSNLGVQEHKLPKHPDFATYEARIRSFAKWPNSVPQKPEDLASAGFYYEGFGDRVRCFHCDGGLNHWDPDDEPWSQHAHWFPRCCYILLMKGQEFIQQSSPVNDNAVTIPTASSRPSSRRGETPTDQQLQTYLDSDQARSALSVGLQLDRVKRAIKNKLEETGVGFSSSDALIEAALNLQIDDEDFDSPNTSNSNLSKTVSIILEDVLHSAVSGQPKSTDGGVVKKEIPKNDYQRKNGEQMSLEEENRQLKEARMCKICMDAEVGIVLLPCGHLTSCVQCAPNLKDCPLCRAPIKATVRTFFS